MDKELFWDNYLKEIKVKLKALMATKKRVLVDLHMHSIYSVDGTQTLDEILENAKKYHFDVIAITDHDSIDVYQDVYQAIKEKRVPDDLIIIPGVELTMDEREYGGQCHILQYMFNPENSAYLKVIEKAKQSYRMRADIQMERININPALQYYAKERGFQFDIDDFWNFLSHYEKPIPEYDTMAEYVLRKLLEHDITVLDIFDQLEKCSQDDSCDMRRQLRLKRYQTLREKYKDRVDNATNRRLLLSILAVKNDDDDYFPDYQGMGSLSVNSHGQDKIKDLNFSFPTIFAHPTEKSLPFVEEKLKEHNFVALEDNVRNPYQNKKALDNLVKRYNLVKIKGSDAHDATGSLYADISFYQMESKDLGCLL